MSDCEADDVIGYMARYHFKDRNILIVSSDHDYLQLVETSGGSERRYEQVSEISRGVKRLAREFNVPVVVLAQLNREIEKDGRKPRPSDLRDSGSIEQDADVILMPARQDGQEEHPDSFLIDLNIAKQRNGPVGKVPLKFLKRYAKFIETQAAETVRLPAPPR